MPNNLPPSVQAQSEASEKLIENLNNPTPQVEVVEEIQPRVELPSPPVMEDPTPPVVEEKPPVQEPVVQTASDEELRKAEARNASLQGIAEANGKMIKEQAAEIARLTQVAEDAKKQSAEPINYADGLFNEDETENLGEEYTGAMSKAVNVAVEKALAEQRAELDKIHQTQNQSQEQTFWSSVMGRLGIGSSELETLDNSSEFNQWLASSDGMSGQTLDQSLRQAIGRNDIEATIKFYNTYQSSKGNIPAPKKPITTTGNESVQAQIVDGNKKKYSVAEYKDIVAKWTSGRLKHSWTEDQFNKYCNEFDQATIDNRLRA